MYPKFKVSLRRALMTKAIENAVEDQVGKIDILRRDQCANSA